MERDMVLLPLAYPQLGFKRVDEAKVSLTGTVTQIATLSSRTIIALPVDPPYNQYTCILL